MLTFILCVSHFCQIIIGEDGTYGTNISHAGADGTTLNRLVEHTIEYM